MAKLSEANCPFINKMRIRSFSLVQLGGVGSYENELFSSIL